MTKQISTKPKEVLSVFGLGKLGCTMLACFAHKGWNVIGVDVIPETVEKLNRHESPIYEPGVAELIAANSARIRGTTDVGDAIKNSDVSFIIVPTPSVADGSFTTKYLDAAIAEIGSILCAKNKYHLVVITSTVLPGDMLQIKELLERTSGKKCTQDFGLCYNPDFIALGNIVHDFLNPDMILIGESDLQAGAQLSAIHHDLIDSVPQVHRMNFYNAELSKIALNSYCTVKITYANMLAEICEAMPGGDAAVVAAAIGADTRVGHKYLRGGLSYGGPCFPRDNRALARSAERFGVETPLPLLVDKLNTRLKKERIPQKMLELLKRSGGNRVSVLGCTYKKDTTLTEESAVIPIIQALVATGVSVALYDPAGLPSAKRELASCAVDFCGSAKECLAGADVALIGTNWNEFRLLKEDDFLTLMRNPILIDAWGMYDFSSKIKTVRLGASEEC